MKYIDGLACQVTRYLCQHGWHWFQGRANTGDVVLRWGPRFRTYPEGVIVLNPVLHTSKIDQAALFLRNNVSIPTTIYTEVQWVELGRPTLVRKPEYGSKGIGVVKTNTPRFEQSKLYQIYIHKNREFRAMITGRWMVFVMEKHPPTNNDFRWNEYRGGIWTAIPEDDGLRKRIKQVAQKAIQALHYDLGAVDIVEKDGNYYVLEVNSRPQFGNLNTDRFLRTLDKLIERR